METSAYITHRFLAAFFSFTINSHLNMKWGLRNYMTSAGVVCQGKISEHRRS